MEYCKCKLLEIYDHYDEKNKAKAKDINESIEVYNSMLDDFIAYENKWKNGKLKTAKHIKKLGCEYVCEALNENAVYKIYADMVLGKKVHYKAMDYILKDEFMEIYNIIEGLYKEVIKNGV